MEEANEEANTDTTYCLKTCNKDCWRKASNYKFVGDRLYSFTNECIEEGEKNEQSR